MSQKSRGNLGGFWLFRWPADSVVVRPCRLVSAGLAELGQMENKGSKGGRSGKGGNQALMPGSANWDARGEVFRSAPGLRAI
jgi:hypothetical protein